VPKQNSFRDLPNLLVADKNGTMFDIPELLAAGMEGAAPVLPASSDFIELPYGSDLFLLPDRIPVGYDPEAGDFVLLPEYEGERVFPVAAFMAPAHMQYYLPAYREHTGDTSRRQLTPLPLYGYSAAGWRGEKTFVTGTRIDPDIRQDLARVDFDAIDNMAPGVLQRFPENRLVEHLVENCALCYGCPAARNFVLGRWECPVPTSRVCNAGCIGCISYQPDTSGINPAQDRIAFTPTVAEIVEFTVPHLEHADNPVISFGQGCEGEPLLAADLIAEAIAAIRKQTGRGTININTNGSLPGEVEKLCNAGLDSIRVSMNSLRGDVYRAYYRPGNYTFDDVLESISVVSHHGKWTSLNYFIFPGVTDHPDEIAELFAYLKKGTLNMIQTRNTNIDPLFYWRGLGFTVEEDTECVGMAEWLRLVRTRFPELKLGYFNPQVR
jgi:pyruvate-formate lyase-activating enzyme